mmetsp:Transcript_173104/g.555059  ORF Transcript_173104/g.555059 Transcript_173104/m.555059 type:complete len:238 (-) Transcript_173104:800-1513(-)
MRPVLGSKIVVFSSVMEALNSPIFLLEASMPAFVSERSLSHQLFCSMSAAPSLSMSPNIFSISSSTTLKGLFAWSMEMMRPKRGDEPLTSSAAWRKPMAFLRGSASLPAPARSASWRCLRMTAPRWKNCCAPEDVAETPPKVAKAASLLRMAMASARAVSSDARSSTRVSYCFFFAAHMSKSLAKKSSASALVLSADSSCVLFAARSPSLSENRPCLVLYSDAIASWASSMSFVYLL